MPLSAVMYGSMKPATRMKCGGWTGCEDLHEFWAPQDVMVLNEAQSLDDICDEHGQPHVVAKAVSEGTLVHIVEKNYVIPTVLGMWYDDCAVN